MYARSIILKIVLFLIIFTILFWSVRLNNLIPDYKLAQDLSSIPILFGAGNLVFSVISAFIIQTQWTKWDRIVVATRGEINMLRQLYILAHHFPIPERNEIRFQIYSYLKTYIHAANIKNYASYKKFLERSAEVDHALVKVEDTMFTVSKKYPESGALAFSYLTRAMEFREQKLQNTTQKLPAGIKFFVIFGATAVIFNSLFIPFTHLLYNYYFTLIVASLIFGVYLIIDDFDHPYKPGNFYLTVRSYRVLMEEIQAKLEQRGYDIAKAEAKNARDER